MHGSNLLLRTKTERKRFATRGRPCMDFEPGRDITGGTKSMRKPRRNHSAAFKARVALEAIRGEKTIAEIAAPHEVHPNQVTTWKTQALENMAGIFGGAGGVEDGEEQVRQPREENGR